MHQQGLILYTTEPQFQLLSAAILPFLKFESGGPIPGAMVWGLKLYMNDHSPEVMEEKEQGLHRHTGNSECLAGIAWEDTDPEQYNSNPKTLAPQRSDGI